MDIVQATFMAHTFALRAKRQVRRSNRLTAACYKRGKLGRSGVGYPVRPGLSFNVKCGKGGTGRSVEYAVPQRLGCPDIARTPSANQRRPQQGFGPVCPVVWEGRRRECPPIPIIGTGPNITAPRLFHQVCEVLA
jgi:hypothetical protein